MKRLFCFAAALLVLLSAGCAQGGENKPDGKTPIVNEGGFAYDSTAVGNGNGSAEFPQFTGLDGCGDLEKLNRLIAEDALSPFGEEDLAYKGTFIECGVQNGVLTVEFYGTYGLAEPYYTVHFFANYRLETAARLETGDLVDLSALLSALKGGRFHMPESELFASVWKDQKSYITQRVDSADGVSVFVNGDDVLVAVPVPHSLYDVAVVAVESGDLK